VSEPRLNILQLNTGLFPDAQTVAAALRPMAETHRVAAVDLRRRGMTESDWDEAIRSILAADLIISI
jgi:hypothetical protein